jgi:hypothetical protein
MSRVPLGFEFTVALAPLRNGCGRAQRPPCGPLTDRILYATTCIQRDSISRASRSLVGCTVATEQERVILP